MVPHQGKNMRTAHRIDVHQHVVPPFWVEGVSEFGKWNSNQAQQQAYGQMYRTVLCQAQTLACVDTFWMLALGGPVMVALSLLMKKNDPRAGGQVAVH